MKMMPQQQEQEQASFHVTMVPGKCCRHCMMMVQAVRYVEPRRARQGQRYRRRQEHQGPQGCGPPPEERRHRARPGTILWMARTKRQLVALKPRDLHAGRTSSSGEVHRDSQWGRWPSRYEQARKTNNHHDGACCSISLSNDSKARQGVRESCGGHDVFHQLNLDGHASAKPLRELRRGLHHSNKMDVGERRSAQRSSNQRLECASRFCR